MAVFRVEKTRDYTVMSNHHLKNRTLSLKAKGLMSLMLSLPDDWDYTLKGLAKLCCDGVDSVRNAVVQLETEGYIVRRQGRDAHGRLSANEYVVYEIPQREKPVSDLPLSGNPTTEKPSTAFPLSENPTQSITKKQTTQVQNTYSCNDSSINPSWERGRRMDVMEERNSYREMILENIEYDIIANRDNRERLDEIVEIMLDAVCSTRDTIRINGEDMPKEVVKSRFLKITSSHIEYVFDALKNNPSDIRNIRNYLLTTLYNAPLTMDSYWTARVNHDFYGQ
ncbi:MAG: DUF6017 domain-containing protein [Candidatus Methanomethylophilaceae archaeon]|jgi:hypothetical protein|nr:DUF6017 domain-containing protein [Candidatus Methanomethylophilaceae archaeon]NCB52563.1 helix-turn-helix domain-containing protein [Clostridia bacterium]